MKYRGFYVMKKRKAFNFYRSYYEVAMNLDSIEREKFLTAILRKQFEDVEPNLDGMSGFAYLSQKHSIDSQVDGYKNKVGYQPPTEPPIIPPTEPPSVQEKEKGKEEEKELEKVLVKLNII